MVLLLEKSIPETEPWIIGSDQSEPVVRCPEGLGGSASECQRSLQVSRLLREESLCGEHWNRNIRGKSWSRLCDRRRGEKVWVGARQPFVLDLKIVLERSLLTRTNLESSSSSAMRLTVLMLLPPSPFKLSTRVFRHLHPVFLDSGTRRPASRLPSEVSDILISVCSAVELGIRFQSKDLWCSGS